MRRVATRSHLQPPQRHVPCSPRPVLTCGTPLAVSHNTPQAPHHFPPPHLCCHHLSTTSHLHQTRPAQEDEELHDSGDRVVRKRPAGAPAREKTKRRKPEAEIEVDRVGGKDDEDEKDKDDGGGECKKAGR